MPRAIVFPRFSTCKTGSAIDASRNWRHNSAGMEDKKQSEAQNSNTGADFRHKIAGNPRQCLCFTYDNAL